MTSTEIDITSQNGGGGGDFSITAAAIAERFGGQLIGDGGVAITGIAPLDLATSADLSLLIASRYADEFSTTRAGAVLIKEDFRSLDTRAAARIVVKDPLRVLAAFLPEIYPLKPLPVGVHPTAVLGKRVTLGARVHIGANVVLGDGSQVGDDTSIGANTVVGEGVQIGHSCTIYSNVSLYTGAVVRNRVTIHSGARIASDGFGYVSGAEGHEKIRHIGRCVVEDDVEIGANSCIDRGSIGDTVIGSGSKLDNLVHIAHNVRIGRRCLIIAQVGIAGSSRLDDGVVLAGQAGVAGHMRLGKGVKIGAQAGVISDVPDGETWSGFPARPHRESMKAYAALFKLSALMKKLEALVGEKR